MQLSDCTTEALRVGYIALFGSFSVSACVLRTAPISIGHFPISLCLAWVGTAPISIGHSSYQFSSTSRVFVQYDIQSHIFSFGIQSHYAYSFRHFWVTMYHPFFTLILIFPHFVTLCSLPIHHCFFRFPFSLLMARSFEFTIRIFVMLLGTLHSAFSYSSPRAVSFERSLFYTLRWFDRYSFLTSIFESLLETS